MDSTNDIRKVLRAAGFPKELLESLSEVVDAWADQEVLVERAACAKIASDEAEESGYWPDAARHKARVIAAKIAARK